MSNGHAPCTPKSSQLTRATAQSAESALERTHIALTVEQYTVSDASRSRKRHTGRLSDLRHGPGTHVSQRGGGHQRAG